jgi:hypothetical protein
MTEQAQQPVGTSGARRTTSLYRTVLSVAIAALVAAWLPFSILYIDALSKHAVAVAKAGGATQTAGASAGPAVPSLTPVTTRTS